jgi:predicted acetyltransferase
MMAALREDAVEHGEPVSILTASEGGIYGRFGYGVARWRWHVHVDRAHSAFARPVRDDGRIRYVDRNEAFARFPEVYARACLQRAGMVSRPQAWWGETFFNIAPPDKATFFVLHENTDGVADGFFIYEISGEWTEGVNRKRLRIVDFITLTSVTRAALWQFAFSVDLVETVACQLAAVDDPLRFLLADLRRLRVDAVNDGLWIQIIDVERALEARRYSTEERVVLEVHGADAAPLSGMPPPSTYAGGATVTRVVLDGGPDGAHCTTTSAEPDLVLGLAQLGSIYLGGVRAEHHAAVGTVEERTPGAITRVDAMFASYPVPAALTYF